jgi:hypothetical protein
VSNAQRLTTPFDVYETLFDVLYFDGEDRPASLAERGISLLRYLESRRRHPSVSRDDGVAQSEMGEGVGGEGGRKSLIARPGRAVQANSGMAVSVALAVDESGWLLGKPLLLPQFPPGSLVDGIVLSCCFCTCFALPNCLAPSGAVVSQALPFTKYNMSFDNKVKPNTGKQHSLLKFSVKENSLYKKNPTFRLKAFFVGGQDRIVFIYTELLQSYLCPFPMIW